MNLRSAVVAVCLVTGLECVLPGGVSAVGITNQVQLIVAPNKDLSHVYFLYGASSGGSFSATATALADIPGGATNTINFGALAPSDSGIFSYSVLALYDTGNKLVTMGFNNVEGLSLISSPRSFETEFPSYTEAGIGLALLNGDTATLQNFFMDPTVQGTAGIALGDSGRLINFSLSTDGGYILASVPEPTTLSLFVTSALAGIGLLSGIRRATTSVSGRH